MICLMCSLAREVCVKAAGKRPCEETPLESARAPGTATWSRVRGVRRTGMCEDGTYTCSCHSTVGWYVRAPPSSWTART
jgi:hypothetical protein